ncbi:MAG: SPOR domain-containing protein [Alphaproteobacteria bacterium]|nr:SPOR domain-containing protein [Alphaproteobacteria bacterium]
MRGQGRGDSSFRPDWVRLAAPILLAIVCLAQPALARSHHRAPTHKTWHKTAHSNWHPAYRRPAAVDWGTPTDPAKDAELVLDGRTGRVLYGRNASAQRHPASLTKMMTLYLLFDALKKGQVTLNSPIYISQHAAWQKPTKLGLPAGDWLPVDMAIRAAVVLSANDIAVAIAEGIGGTESHFAELMTQKAHELGMRNTFYHNASGLPDDRQITTASDLGILARRLAYDFPQYFHYFSLPGFTYRGRVHLGHDNLLGRYAGTDGIKTGYTNASGFNLVSSVVRNGAHVIGVVMGGYTARRRDAEMMRLLDWTFAQISMQPALVARAEVPWQSVAQSSASAPVIAGFQFGSSQPPPQSAMQSYAAVASRGGELDEEAAETRTDDDEIAKIINTTPPKPQVGAQPVRTAAPSGVPPSNHTTNLAMLSAPAQVSFPKSAPVNTNVPSVTPMPRDNAVPMPPASYQTSSLPQIAPSPRDKNMAGQTPASTAARFVAGSTSALADRSWTVQIGAFGDVPTARAQLAAYAQRSMGMFAQADRIIVPFTGTDGKTMFRARFGTFVEAEARSICTRLLRNGHTCFPATLAR